MFFTKEIPHMTSILPTVILLCLTKRCMYIFSLSKEHTVNGDVLLAIINLQAISGEPSSSVHCLPECQPTAHNADWVHSDNQDLFCAHCKWISLNTLNPHPKLTTT